MLCGYKTLAGLAAVVLSAAVAPAAVLFSDDFDADTSSAYTVKGDTDSLVQFNYDYSTMGIPSPTPGGTTRGVLFKANYLDQTAGAAATNISPTGRSFTGDYRLKFDAWMNVNGPFPGGGAGSTEFFTAGVGTTGSTLHKSSGDADGGWFAADNEGGSGIDFRAYRGTALEGPSSTAYAAPDDGTINRRNADNTYYHTTFPGGQEAPQFQRDNYAQQTGALKAGTLGFAWRAVEIDKIGNDVTWSIDGLPIATLTNATLPGDNVFVGYWDVFSSVSDNASLSFGLIDNLQVMTVPEPAALVVAAALPLVLRRRR